MYLSRYNFNKLETYERWKQCHSTQLVFLQPCWIAGGRVLCSASSLTRAPAAPSLRGTASNPVPLTQALPNLMSLHKQLISIQPITLIMVGTKTSWNTICCWQPSQGPGHTKGPTTPPAMFSNRPKVNLTYDLSPCSGFSCNRVHFLSSRSIGLDLAWE